MGAFDDYASFETTFLQWADNADIAAQVDGFLALAHRRLDTELRLEATVRLASSLTGAGNPWVPKPDRMLTFKRLREGTGSDVVGLDYRSLSEFDDQHYLNQQGRPTNFTVLGDRIRLGPIPDGEYTLEIAYYRQPDVIGPTQAMNEYLEVCPHLLLYACLCETEPFIRDVEMAALWQEKYRMAINEVNEQTEHNRYPDGMLTVRSA